MYWSWCLSTVTVQCVLWEVSVQLPVDRSLPQVPPPHVWLFLTASVKKLTFDFACLGQDMLLGASGLLLVDVTHYSSPLDTFLYKFPFKTWLLLKGTHADMAIFNFFSLATAKWNFIAHNFRNIYSWETWCHSKFLFTCITEMLQSSLGLLLEARWMSDEIPFTKTKTKLVPSCLDIL